MNMTMKEALLKAGITEGRVRDVTDPNGEIDLDELTDEELEAVATDKDRPFPGAKKWDEMTDEELRRIADGESARDVLS